MAEHVRKPLSPEVAKQIADVAGLDVDEVRAGELAPQVQALLDQVGRMDAVDLTDVEPATLLDIERGWAP